LVMTEYLLLAAAKSSPIMFSNEAHAVVAVTQAEPEWLDLPKSVLKTCKFIDEAAKGGTKLIAFPECWIPGYPAWIW
jgi:hypothetical protein